MLKKIKQYVQWLFQGNVLNFQPKESDQQLVFEGKSKAFHRLMLNSALSLGIMLLPVPPVALHLRHPVIIFIAIVLMLAGFICFCLGIIAMAYQPFWLHKNRLIFTQDTLHMMNSLGIKQGYQPHKLKAFTLRYDFNQQGAVHIQMWVNHRKAYFLNAHLTHFANSAHDLFEQLKPYFKAWGFQYIHIPAQGSSQSGSWTLTRTGKTLLAPNLSLATLQQKSQEDQLIIGEEAEEISQYLVQKQNETLEVSRPKNYAKKMWWGVGISFVVGAAIIFGLIYLLIHHPTKNDAGAYVFLAVVGFLWLIFLAAFYSSATEAFRLRVSPQEVCIRHRKKEVCYPRHQVQQLALNIVISKGRYTYVTGHLNLIVNQDGENKPLTLLKVDSGRPEKIDTPLVRDATYQRSIRLAQLLAQPMGLSVHWQGFQE